MITPGSAVVTVSHRSSERNSLDNGWSRVTSEKDLPKSEKPKRKIKDTRITRNSAICLLCNTEIESKHHHHFHGCPCKALYVDGGRDYLRRLGNFKDYKETSTYEEYERDPYEWETEEWLREDAKRKELKTEKEKQLDFKWGNDP
jgi:predicted glycosyl hydrolase (DUF1957 family)